MLAHEIGADSLPHAGFRHAGHPGLLSAVVTGLRVGRASGWPVTVGGKPVDDQRDWRAGKPSREAGEIDELVERRSQCHSFHLCRWFRSDQGSTQCCASRRVVRSGSSPRLSLGRHGPSCGGMPRPDVLRDGTANPRTAALKQIRRTPGPRADGVRVGGWRATFVWHGPTVLVPGPLFDGRAAPVGRSRKTCSLPLGSIPKWGDSRGQDGTTLVLVELMPPGVGSPAGAEQSGIRALRICHESKLICLCRGGRA